MNDFQQFYLPSTAAFIGCFLFVLLRQQPHVSNRKLIADALVLLITSVFCGAGAYLLASAYLSKPEDALIPSAVIPFSSGFIVPSLLRGLTVILQQIQTAPLETFKLITEAWKNRK